MSLLNLILEVTGADPVDVTSDTTLFDLGLTEAQVPELCRRIKEEFGLEISDSDVLAAQSVASLLDAASPAVTVRPRANSGTSFTKSFKWLSVAMLFPTVSGFSGFELDAAGCVTNFDPTVDYFSPERRAMTGAGMTVPSTVKFASDFEIEYHHTFKVLRNLKNGQVYVLHQCGTGDAVPAAELPTDAASAPVFSVPANKWSTGGTVPIHFMELLGLVNKAAMVDMSYVSSSCLHKLVYNCTDPEVEGTMTAGWPASNTSHWATNLSASGSTVHFTDDWGTGKSAGRKCSRPCLTTRPPAWWLQGLTPLIRSPERRLSSLGACRGPRSPPQAAPRMFTRATPGKSWSTMDVAFDATSDPGMLARAEWIKFVAAFFNLEAHANRVFEKIKAEYDSTKASAAAAIEARRPPSPLCPPPPPRTHRRPRPRPHRRSRCPDLACPDSERRDGSHGSVDLVLRRLCLGAGVVDHLDALVQDRHRRRGGRPDARRRRPGYALHRRHDDDAHDPRGQVQGVRAHCHRHHHDPPPYHHHPTTTATVTPPPPAPLRAAGTSTSTRARGRR